MAEVVNDHNDHDLINFNDFFNDIDFNSVESFDKYLDNQNSYIEDKIDSNIAINCFSPIINNANNDLNSSHNQWLPQNNDIHPNTDIHYQFNEFNSNRFEAIPNDFAIERVNQSLIDPDIGSAHTFEVTNSYNQNHYQNQITEQFSYNRYNGFQFNDHIFRQNSSQTIDYRIGITSAAQRLATNQLEAEDLPEPITQLNGQVLSAQEFEKQNETELLCDEQMDQTSHQSSLQSGVKSRGREEESLNGVNDLIPVDNNNNNIVNIENIVFPPNPKTYSRVLRVIRMSTPLPVPLSSSPPQQRSPHKEDKEVVAAVKGLVMLRENSCRPTVIQCKGKKGNTSQLCFAERQRLKRERNRIASKKCRQKKLETIGKLEQIKEILFEENQKFENHLKNCRQRLMELKSLLLFHRLNDCQLGDIQN